eukprot:m.7455 g.7455  ORF g.7455 m.7455 type:complete len:225 (+) comp5780_c0_seq1:271-945(+)
MTSIFQHNGTMNSGSLVLPMVAPTSSISSTFSSTPSVSCGSQYQYQQQQGYHFQEGSSNTAMFNNGNSFVHKEMSSCCFEEMTPNNNSANTSAMDEEGDVDEEVDEVEDAPAHYFYNEDDVHHNNSEAVYSNNKYNHNSGMYISESNDGVCREFSYTTIDSNDAADDGDDGECFEFDEYDQEISRQEEIRAELMDDISTSRAMMTESYNLLRLLQQAQQQQNRI